MRIQRLEGYGCNYDGAPDKAGRESDLQKVKL